MTQKVINILGHENVLTGSEQLDDAIFTKIARIVKRCKYGTHQEMSSQDGENRRVVAFNTTPAAVDDAVNVG